MDPPAAGTSPGAQRAQNPTQPPAARTRRARPSRRRAGLEGLAVVWVRRIDGAPRSIRERLTGSLEPKATRDRRGHAGSQWRPDVSKNWASPRLRQGRLDEARHRHWSWARGARSGHACLGAFTCGDERLGRMARAVTGRAATPQRDGPPGGMPRRGSARAARPRWALGTVGASGRSARLDAAMAATPNDEPPRVGRPPGGHPSRRPPLWRGDAGRAFSRLPIQFPPRRSLARFAAWQRQSSRPGSSAQAGAMSQLVGLAADHQRQEGPPLRPAGELHQHRAWCRQPGTVLRFPAIHPTHLLAQRAASRPSP